MLTSSEDAGRGDTYAVCLSAIQTLRFAACEIEDDETGRGLINEAGLIEQDIDCDLNRIGQPSWENLKRLFLLVRTHVGPLRGDAYFRDAYYWLMPGLSAAIVERHEGQRRMCAEAASEGS